MLHSGSRGIGNLIGQTFIELARADMKKHFINLPDRDLAYLVEGTEHFDDYVEAMHWAQDYAAENRRAMMDSVLRVLREELRPFQLGDVAVNCHHNYTARETHFGEDVLVTRKGAVRAGRGELGIIPGSMGARSYIVRGLGNPESFESCSHGAGRTMSRTEARKRFTRRSARRGDGGRRVPQGRGRHRRDAGGLQGHRRRHGRAARSRRDRAYVEAGRVRQGVKRGRHRRFR